LKRALGKLFSREFIQPEKLTARSLVINDTTQRWNEQNSCIGYIYFDYNIQKEQTIANIVRMLLKQILVQSHSIPHALGNAYDDWYDRCKVPDEGIFSVQLIATFATFPSAFVMLDALDECSEESLQRVIDLIRRISGQGVNVFCTSRTHLINLKEQLENLTMVRIEAHDDDVRKYLTSRLRKEKRFTRFSEKIIEHLTSNIERTQVSLLCPC
jgi:hypothetical protein